jgi:hypothetical protein
MPDETIDKILTFLEEIGIPATDGEVADDTFLPGIEVQNGSLVVDKGKLRYPGDLLHEAGHIAVSPAEIRSQLSGKVELPERAPHLVELEAMLWSYAACLYLSIDSRVVFHDDGYKGKAVALLQNFELGVFHGVNGLVAAGMTLSPDAATTSGGKPFPAMQKWLRS